MKTAGCWCRERYFLLLMISSWYRIRDWYALRASAYFPRPRKFSNSRHSSSFNVLSRENIKSILYWYVIALYMLRSTAYLSLLIILIKEALISLPLVIICCLVSIISRRTHTSAHTNKSILYQNIRLRWYMIIFIRRWGQVFIGLCWRFTLPLSALVIASKREKLRHWLRLALFSSPRQPLHDTEMTVDGYHFRFICFWYISFPLMELQRNIAGSRYYGRRFSSRSLYRLAAFTPLFYIFIFSRVAFVIMPISLPLSFCFHNIVYYYIAVGIYFHYYIIYFSPHCKAPRERLTMRHQNAYDSASHHGLILRHYKLCLCTCTSLGYRAPRFTLMPMLHFLLYFSGLILPLASKHILHILIFHKWPSPHTPYCSVYFFIIILLWLFEVTSALIAKIFSCW